MQLTIGGKHYNGGHPLIMGILNVTPDSFSDGGQYLDPVRAAGHAAEMVEEGADIIDIGGESSRPGADPVDADEELRRVIPVISAIKNELDVPISIDTYKASVAREALDAGASIVNDISALEFDESMVSVLSDSDANVILMHMQGSPRTMQKSPEYGNVTEEVITYLKERIAFAESRGITRDRIIVDPGIGFGKNIEHNLSLLASIDRLHETGCPVLVGASRKSMIGMISGDSVEDRLGGTAAITAYCVLRGIEIHRVHDVREMRQAAAVAQAIRNSAKQDSGSQSWT